MAKVQTILGEADTESSKIYAESYGGTPERESFNEFMKLLKSYDKISDEKTTGLLSTKSELFRLFNGMDSD
ncbi:MAG: hypothetical protein VCA40_05600 [Roseibacillus sp.]